MNRLLIIMLSLTTFTACSQSEKKDQSVESPPGYDFSKPKRYDMPDALQEISGISFQPGKKDVMYAIEDEDGLIYHWKSGSMKTLASSRFADEGDFEDVAITNIYSFVLRSDGTLFQFPLKDIGVSQITTVREWKDLLPAGEYESMYAAAEKNELYILCKNCGADKKEQTISGYVLQISPSGELALKTSFKINTQDIPNLTGKKKSKKRAPLRPSAMTFNAGTGEWYVLSSVNKLLIIADTTWKVKQVITLNEKEFPQPEGICFDTDHNLYISNEAGDTPSGTVLMFPLKHVAP